MTHQKVGNINDSTVNNVNQNNDNTEVDFKEQTVQTPNETIHTSNKKSVYILPSISILISFLAISIASAKAGITSEFFISLIASLMGVCATIMVGLQIYNSIEFNRAIKDINKKQEMLSKEIEDVRRNSNLHKSQLRLVQGISISINQQYISAIYSLYWAMEYAILANDYKEMNLIMSNMQKIYDTHIKEENISSILFQEEDDIKERFLNINLKSLPNSRNFLDFKVQFERIISEIQNRLQS